MWGSFYLEIRDFIYKKNKKTLSIMKLIPLFKPYTQHRFILIYCFRAKKTIKALNV